MRVDAKGLLLIPFLIAYLYVHGQLSSWVMWVPELFADRSYRSAGLLSAVVSCGVLAGLLFAFPIKLLYQQNAFSAALLVSLGAGAFDAAHMQLDGALPLTQLALVLDLVVFFLALPVAVLVYRRFHPDLSIKPKSLRDAA